jgi:hypothetical protein
VAGVEAGEQLAIAQLVPRGDFPGAKQPEGPVGPRTDFPGAKQAANQ